MRSQDTKFLSEATEQLIACRRVLQYSYVMGYYLDKSKGAEKNLFEYLQEDLEKHTNHLSELYEMNLDSVKVFDSITRVTRIGLSRVYAMERKRDQLYSCYQEVLG